LLIITLIFRYNDHQPSPPEIESIESIKIEDEEIMDAFSEEEIFEEEEEESNNESEKEYVTYSQDSNESCLEEENHDCICATVKRKHKDEE